MCVWGGDSLDQRSTLVNFLASALNLGSSEQAKASAYRVARSWAECSDHSQDGPGS